MRKIKVLALCAMALVAASCDELVPPEETLSADANRIANNAAQDTNEPITVYGDDGPSEPVLVHLPDLNNLKDDGVENLEIEIEDLSNNQYDVNASLACNGLINQRGKADLGKLKFDREAIHSVHIKAADLPIQQQNGFASCRMELVLNRDTPQGTKSRTMRSQPFYIHHSNDYSKAILVDENTLFNKFGKEYAAATDAAGKMAASGKKIGRTKDGVTFTEIKTMNDLTAVWENGTIVGWDMGGAPGIEELNIEDLNIGEANNEIDQ